MGLDFANVGIHVTTNTKPCIAQATEGTCEIVAIFSKFLDGLHGFLIFDVHFYVIKLKQAGI